MGLRTDLAMEDYALWRSSARQQTELRGVRARETTEDGIKITTVEILDEEGRRALGKPVGTYVTLEGAPPQAPAELAVGAARLSRYLCALLPRAGHVLVAGLGNEAVTPDAVGPEVLRSVIVTRHLKRMQPELFRSFATVSALQPGVLGTTGAESAELIAATVDKLRPDAVIAVDAVAAREPGRLCRTVQLSTAGIVPGSGVGNARSGISRETLGIPVLAVGVPTVMDLGGAAWENERIPAGMVLTPRDIDAKIKQLGRWIGIGIDLALHEGLDAETAAGFLP